MAQTQRHKKANRVFYGDPDDTIEELMKYQTSEIDSPPRDGDELCDGHQMHYIWEDGKWQ